jgi:cytochrome b subunit of formate dehydrogenase
MSPALLAVLGLLLQAPPDDDCLACHADRELVSADRRSLFTDGPRLKATVHGGFACADCHAGIKELPHAERLPKVDCASCHDDVAKQYAASVHGRARSAGVGDAASCGSCHGPAHLIVAGDDPASRVAKPKLAGTCGGCHSDPDFLVRHKIPFAKPVEAYTLSVHGRALERGSKDAPSCSNCHGSHAILPARDLGSKINHWNVPATCGACHRAIHEAYAGSVHGQAVAHSMTGAPVCTDCHGEHTILAPSEPGSLVSPARVSSVTCGRCHGDERLAARYNLPKDKVPAFDDSFHGLALRSGSQTVANCASCHGVHNILASSDPRSTVHASKLPATCGNCHPGAGARFAIGPVHVRSATRTEHASVRWIRLFYWMLIPATLGLMFVHNALDFFAKLWRPRPRPHSAEQLPRMNLHFRIAHWLVVLSFPTLAWTGFALKYPEAWWAAPLLHFEGSVAFRGLVHRVSAVLLTLALVYHAVHLALVPRDRAMLRQLLPGRQDVWDVLRQLAWSVGRATEPPRFKVFSYAEKAEYLAFVWGTVIMVASGLVLWFNDFSLRHFPTWVADAATAVHWYEAILATLAIAIWHFYMVVFDPDVYPMDAAWITGRASADHLRHRRPAYHRWLRMLARRERPPS